MGPRHLATQDLELVTKDEQLDVLDVQTAATPNERAQQALNATQRNEKATVGDPRNPPAKVATRVLAPFRGGWLNQDDARLGHGAARASWKAAPDRHRV